MGGVDESAVNDAPAEKQGPVLPEKAESPVIQAVITDASEPGDDAASSDYLKLVPVLEDRLATPSLRKSATAANKPHRTVRNNWPIVIVLFGVMLLVTVVAGLYQSATELFDDVLDRRDGIVEIHRGGQPIQLDRVIRSPEPDVAESEAIDSNAEIDPVDQSQVADEADEASAARIESREQTVIEEE